VGERGVTESGRETYNLNQTFQRQDDVRTCVHSVTSVNKTDGPTPRPFIGYMLDGCMWHSLQCIVIKIRSFFLLATQCI